MQVFYAPDINSDYYTLDEKESRHLVRVLRMKKDSPVKLIDGRGNLYEGIIENPDQRKCGIHIVSAVKNFESRNYRLHIAISPLKNPERFEWFVEKSVEIGIDEITPLICKNSEKPAIKTERISNIIVSAMKQSIKARLTVLNNMTSFNDFIDTPAQQVIKMIACCSNNFERITIGKACPANTDALILIGPEGDFTSDEIASAVNKGFLPVHLGKSRLRTETAGVAACHSLYFINQL